MKRNFGESDSLRNQMYEGSKPHAKRVTASTELTARRAEIIKGAGMALLLEELSRLNTSDSIIKTELRAKLKEFRVKIEKLEDEDLKEAYFKLSETLKRHFSRTESVTTTYEKKFLEYFRGRSRLKIEDNFWIGNFQVDAVVPSVSKGKSVGIVFEIDGPVHDRENKIKKDSYKMEFLKRHFKTPVYSIPNHNVTVQEVHTIVDRLQEQHRTDSKKLRGWWRRVYIYTLAFGGQRANSEYSRKIINELLGLTSEQVDQLISIMRKKRTVRFDSSIKTEML